MTDAEILRSCEGCTSQHLRLVADRLRVRVDTLREIGVLAKQISTDPRAADVRTIASEIRNLTDDGEN